MKSSEESGKFPKYVLDEVYSSLGDVSHVRSIGQIPRRPQDMCNARRSIPSQKVGSIENTVVKLDRIWMLLERARWEEENSLQEKFIRECCIHPDFLVVQANDLQLQELEHICTNPSEFCVFSVDPTFNVFKDMIWLTVTVYKNLNLAQRKLENPWYLLGPCYCTKIVRGKRFPNFRTVL